MARLTYVSRSRGAHDERFVAALRHGGHEVTVAGLDDVSATGADLLVAGPLTDAAPAAVATGARVLGIAWGFDVLVETRDPAVRERAAAAVAGCVGVHVDCEAVRREVVALGADPAGVSLAPWGIDTDFFAPGPAPDGLRERHGLGPDDLVVLSTRAWEALYDVPLVLDGVARIRDVEPRLRLVLAGDGSLAETIRDRIHALGLAPVTVTPGRLDPTGVRAWLRTAEAYVGAATSDGTSLSLLEALACGVPAVVPHLGGNPEWVHGGATGRLYAPGAADALATALAAVLAEGRAGAVERREVVMARGHWPTNRGLFLDAVDRALAVAR